MKNIVFLRNYVRLHVPIGELVDDSRYNLFAICDKVGHHVLRYQDELKHFKKVFVLTEYTYESIKATIREIEKEWPAEETIPVTTRDKGVWEMGRLALAQGRENSDLKQFVDKVVMKQMLASKGIRMPKFLYLPKEDRLTMRFEHLCQKVDSVGYPVFAKPINSAGSTHTRKIHSEPELAKWFNDVKQLPDVDFELDEFIVGTLYHADSFIKNGKIIDTVVSRYSFPCADFFNGHPIGSITLSSSDPNYDRITRFNIDCLDGLSAPCNGMTHLELFIKEDGEIVFVEVAARPPGGYTPDVYEKHLGVNIDKEYIMLRIDDDHEPDITKRYYAAGLYFPRLDGIVSKINSFEVVSNHQPILYTYVGEKLKAASDFGHVAAEIVLWHEDYDVVLNDFDRLSHFALLEMSRNI